MHFQLGQNRSLINSNKKSLIMLIMKKILEIPRRKLKILLE
jgi:hypothetical protein